VIIALAATLLGAALAAAWAGWRAARIEPAEGLRDV
jgi:putative ABC transport system permease protein